MMTSIENIITCFIIGSIFPLQTTSTPMEIAQLVGRNVSLACVKSSSVGIIWRFNEATLLYDGTDFKGIFKGRSHFEIDAATENEVLKISDIKPEDAGLYSCLTASDEMLLRSTQLTVLDSEPTFDSNIKDSGFVGPNTCSLSQDYMRFSCAVSYHGTKAPRLQWEDVKNNQILKDLNCEEKENEATKWINCTLTLKAEPQYDGSVFRCKVVTSYGEQYNCSTKVIKVQYFTREERALNSTHKAIGDKISCSANSSLKLNFIWMREENNKEDVVGRNRSCVIDKEGLYYCNVFYSIKDASCSAVVSVVHASRHTDLSWSQKSLTIVSSLVLFVFAVISYFFLENEKVKFTLENMHKKFVKWSKIILLIFAVLDFAALMFFLANPTETFLHMKYAHTVALLLFIFVEIVILLLLQCNREVPSSIVKRFLGILFVLILCDVVFAIVLTAIVLDKLKDISHGTIDVWVISFILALVIFVFLVLFVFVTFVCSVIPKKWHCKICREFPLLSSTFSEDEEVDECSNLQQIIEARISDAILTNGWTAEKHKILFALHLAGTSYESDFAEILDEEDGKKGISMLVATILRGSEKDYNIFKRVMNDVLKTDLGDVGTIFVKKNDPKAKHGLLCRCCPWFSGRKTEASKVSETQEQELQIPLGKGSAVDV